MREALLKCAAAVMGFAVAFVAGVLIGRGQIQDKFDLYQAKVAQQQAEAVAAAESAIRVQLQSAVDLGNRLSARLSEAETQNRKITQEKNRALQKLTTGRACLGGDVVGLLNQSAIAVSGTGTKPLPQTTSPPDATGRAVATDTDVAA